ncbi:MAG: DJ-1/PfpI family protein [Candidatus Eremiobacteraeota bacterium]|nr:DJ-1/PfpI family protein [Candidatus Eremiobacteraeota bacterium]
MMRPRFLAALAASAAGSAILRPGRAGATENPKDVRATMRAGQRLVAVVVTEGATVIDFAGPWEVFEATPLPSRDDQAAFYLYLVGPSMSAVEATGGMQLLPRYTFANAPRPDVVVVGAQRGAPELIPWLQSQAKGGALMMSVCTGAFKLAQAGLFDGKRATTHHDYYDAFEKQFPKVKLVRGPRFVDEGQVVSAGGLTSGMNLALHVVERLHGKKHADNVAAYLEFVRTERPAAETA